MEKEYNLIDLYLKDIQKYEVINREEEYDLFRRIKEDNSQEARHELILSSPCLLLCILLNRESCFKRLMFVWCFVVFCSNLLALVFACFSL